MANISEFSIGAYERKPGAPARSHYSESARWKCR